ncbi:YxiG family protein [Clostridium amylolyticum]|uniref:YxiG family protein n=1 Tax=Clostridium amylolyticum TaxID=1121298 RepID=UPI003BFA6D77
MKFKGVSSYHFYEDSEEQRINTIEPDDGDYLELTSIQFFKNGVGDITTKSKAEKWAEQYYSNANFVLEI